MIDSGTKAWPRRNMAHCLRDWVLPRRAVIGTGTGSIISIHQILILVVPPIAADVPRVVLAVSDGEHTWTVFPSPSLRFLPLFLAIWGNPMSTLQFRGPIIKIFARSYTEDWSVGDHPSVSLIPVWILSPMLSQLNIVISYITNVFSEC